MAKSYKVVCYVNQFFGQVGGEEKANISPQLEQKAVGVAMGIQGALQNQAEVVGTIICGDSYFNENVEAALEEIMAMLETLKPDLVLAGPAFNAGRYGMACGHLAKTIKQKLAIPVVTGMYIENPAVEMFKKDAYIIETGNSAASMRETLPKMGKLALKLLNQEQLQSPKLEGYIPQGLRTNCFTKQRGSLRAVEMLLKKLKQEPFETEYPMPNFDRVEPAPAIKDLKTAKIALVTSGGIVPKGNPDRIESSSASKYGKYSLHGLTDLTADSHETAHGGYDPVYANQDPDRVLPLDVMRAQVEEGNIAAVYEYFYSTVGNGTSVANSQAFAKEIADDLIRDGVNAVILTST